MFCFYIDYLMGGVSRKYIITKVITMLFIFNLQTNHNKILYCIVT